ncbi:MAG: alpha/beta hydrolase [Patescibacteria group bacterium]|nr:alpha/beta hydrolase [Patescibacteria group bacterium]
MLLLAGVACSITNRQEKNETYAEKLEDFVIKAGGNLENLTVDNKTYLMGKNLYYDEGESDDPLRTLSFALLEQPDNPNQVNLQAILSFHGGGFASGEKEEPENMTSGLWREALSKGNTIIVSADYRLAPSSTWPTQFFDAARALEFTAKIPGVNPKNLTVIGHSSGGTLAALAFVEPEAMLNRAIEIGLPVATVPKFTPVKNIIILSGIMDYPQINFEHLALQDPKDQRQKEMISVEYWVGVYGLELRNKPRFLIFHGMGDSIIPITQSMTICNRLLGYGAQINFFQLPGGHEYSQEEWGTIEQKIRSWLM